MEPERVGRLLGVGARVAAKTLRERVEQAGATPSAGPSGAGQVVQPPAAGAVETRAAAALSAARAATAKAASLPLPAASDDGGFIRRLARGVGRFFATLLRPFAHAGHLLWLQITGVFFGIFALFFLSHAWQTVHTAGWRDRHAEVYCGLCALFVWFAASSFWRAKAKQRR